MEEGWGEWRRGGGDWRRGRVSGSYSHYLQRLVILMGLASSMKKHELFPKMQEGLD